MSHLSRHCVELLFAHATVLNTKRNSIGQLEWEPCHNCRILQSCSNIRRMTCFWWQLTHNITIHTTRLSLKVSCLKTHVKDVPTFAGCNLATHPKSWSCGSRRIGLLTLLLLVLDTSQYPSGFCLEEVTLFVRVDREHPSSGHIIFRLDFLQIDEVKNLVVNQRSVLPMLCFSKLFEVSSYLLSWCFFSCTGSPFGSCSCCSSAVGSHTSFQHVSSSPVNSC